jgi:hypothetical protein
MHESHIALLQQRAREPPHARPSEVISVIQFMAKKTHKNALSTKGN